MSKELFLAQKEYLQEWQRDGVKNEINGFREYVADLASQLPNQHEAVARLAFAMALQAQTMEAHPNLHAAGDLYQILSALANQHAVAHGLPENYIPVHYAVEQQVGTVKIPTNSAVSYEQAQIISTAMRQNHRKVGFLHGHFRLLTPASIVHIINAVRMVDLLIVGLEEGKRTKEHKHKQPLLTDAERLSLMRHLLPIVIMIDEQTPYSDSGYTELCKIVGPNVYFGQNDNPANLRNSMRQRAVTIENCTYIELQTIKGPHTSTIEEALEKAGAE